MINRVIKRDGQEVVFNDKKILNAISAANKEVSEINKLLEQDILETTEKVVRRLESLAKTPTVEDIQNIVEEELIKLGKPEIAKKYIVYRYERALARKRNTTDASILSLVDCKNEEIKQENSNKNPTIASVQRDYVAGEVSKDISRRFLIPEDIMKAHDDGVIHFHDSDYFLQRINNCGLVNLEDMLQNGTVISGTMIEKPHSFHTACNIATQVIAQVASSQFGGQSITLTHLAPFVDVSRQKHRKEVREEFLKVGIAASDEKINEVAEMRTLEEIKKGVQTIQYQVITLMTTNGQAPFVTVFMYLNEAKDERTKADLALVIEESLRQRMKGVKNEKGVWITPAFPKLIYVLQEDNVKPDSKYYYLTKIAAECSAKRLVPDYISEKIMLKEKGSTYPSMGCRSFLSVDRASEVGNISNAENFDGTPKYYGRLTTQLGRP